MDSQAIKTRFCSFTKFKILEYTVIDFEKSWIPLINKIGVSSCGKFFCLKLSEVQKLSKLIIIIDEYKRFIRIFREPIASILKNLANTHITPELHICRINLKFSVYIFK